MQVNFRRALVAGKPRKSGDGVQFVCNPTSEAEFEPPPKQHKENPQAASAASADCESDQDQTDYFLQNGACGVTCNTIGVKGRSIGYDGSRKDITIIF